MPDRSKELTLRFHDECLQLNSFLICVLTFDQATALMSSEYVLVSPTWHAQLKSVHVARRNASNFYHHCAAFSLYVAGGAGVVVYFRKEGRALSEVTKFPLLFLCPT